ncbi:HNH endonuclease [Rhizorhapis suberifaciens]|uniref:HNH nuclease domain-containing protein n=1 Tax=Rhizorhapis suberifaciens TaxID=13656 RepID=A0A840HXR3_9SPHN|nr:hypothetical protein [Rhizorhapis suberifaciens]
MTDIADQFWDNVDQSSGPDGCWPWQRAIVRSGYGSLWVRGRSVGAHRHAYTLANGHIPDGPGYHGYVVMHMCDNRKCCNPAHLRLGTQAENNADRDAKGRADARPKGEENPNARLSQDDVRAIRKMRSDGLSYGKIMSATGVSKSQVWRICKCQSWGWLGDYAASRAA